MPKAKRLRDAFAAFCKELGYNRNSIWNKCMPVFRTMSDEELSEIGVSHTSGWYVTDEAKLFVYLRRQSKGPGYGVKSVPTSIDPELFLQMNGVYKFTEAMRKLEPLMEGITPNTVIRIYERDPDPKATIGVYKMPESSTRVVKMEVFREWFLEHNKGKDKGK